MYIQELYQRIDDLLRRPETDDLPWWQRQGLFLLRLTFAVGEDAARGQLTLRAMSLVYTTLLSMVPLLAVSFSVLKAFGVHNQMRPALGRFLAPLGPRGAEITEQIVAFVENVKVGVLGALGLALLLYTVVALVQKIEQAFNAIWSIRHPRPLLQRFSDYLSVLLIGPVLVFSAMGITASVFGSEWVQSLSTVAPLGLLIETLTRLLPYVLIVAAFTFVYLFIPNTRVRFGSALIGAFVAGVLWQSSGWVFAAMIAGSTRYTAIYSAFATLVVFMIWLYLSWLILLIGASIAYYHQHPRQLIIRGEVTALSPRLQERLALALMALIARAYYARTPAPNADELADSVRLPPYLVGESLQALVEAGFLRPLDNGNAATVYVPATPPETTALAELLAAVRAHGEHPGLDMRALTAPTPARAAGDAWEECLTEALGRRTVRDLVTERGS